MNILRANRAVASFMPRQRHELHLSPQSASKTRVNALMPGRGRRLLGRRVRGLSQHRARRQPPSPQPSQPKSDISDFGRFDDRTRAGPSSVASGERELTESGARFMTIALPAEAAPRTHKLDLSWPILILFSALLIVLIVLPMSWLLYYSFVDRTGAFTLGNFKTLVTDPVFVDPLITTLILATSSSIICCAFAAPMGWLVARTDMPLRRTVRALVTASFVTPPFLGAIAWELLAAPNSGLLNKIYRAATGVPQDEYLFNIYSLPGLIFVISCYTFPYVFVLLANALDRIPGDLEDASSILGGRTWTTARRITIPLALPALLAGALVAFLQAMTLFGSPAILAIPAGFHTMTTKIWSLFNYPPKPELAAAASLPLLVLTVALLRAEHVILGRRGYSVVGGKQGDPRLIKLGRFKWVAIAFVFFVLMCPVFLPYGALLNATFSQGRHLVRVVRQFHPAQYRVRVLRIVRDQARAQEHLHPRHRLRHHRHDHGAGDRLCDDASCHKRLSRARLSRHRAGGDPRHRARRRPVPELRAAAARALRHLVDPAASPSSPSRCRRPISRCSRRSAPCIPISRTPAGFSAQRACAPCATSPRHFCAPA